MTGYTVHTGSSIKFSSGWDLIFQGSKSGGKSPGTGLAKPGKSIKKSVKKSAVKAKKTSLSQVAKKKAAAKTVKRGK